MADNEDTGPASFRDALESVQYGETDQETRDAVRESIENEDEDQDEQDVNQTPAPEGDAEDRETPEAPDDQDKPEESPEPEAEPESAADEVEEDLEDEEAPGEESADDSGSGDEPDEEPPAEEGEETDEPDEDEDENLIELKSGEKVTPSQLKEKYENWQSEYTRQRQRDQETVQQYQERLEARESLSEDVAQHKGLQEFLRNHPEAVGVLMRNPDETRALMADSDALEEFWEEYELLQENPRMAKRFLEPGGEEEVSEEAQQRARAKQTAAIAQELDRVVETVGEEYPEVEAEEVGRELLDMVGLDEEAAQNEQAVHAAMDKLYSLMFVQTNEGLFIDPKLAKDRFEVRSLRQSRDAEKEEEAAESQNKQVDQELERKKERPPAPEGSDPAPSDGGDVEMPEDFNDALQRVQRMHD